VQDNEKKPGIKAIERHSFHGESPGAMISLAGGGALYFLRSEQWE
jgi:hypothetical protein